MLFEPFLKDISMYFIAWQIAFTGIIYPCLVLAYMGEAAYLSTHKSDLQSSFYLAIPGEFYFMS